MVKNSFGLIVWVGLMLVVVILGLWSHGSRLDYPDSVPAQVIDIASDQSTVRLALIAKAASATAQTTQPMALVSIPPDKKDLRARLKGLHPGDLVTYQTEKGTWQGALKDLRIDTPEVSVWERLASFGGAALVVWLFAWVILGKGEIAKLILGIDGLYSKSKFQLVIWFWALMVAYLSTLWLRFCYSSNWLIGAVNLPANLLAISGLSVLSFAGAKAITQTKQDQVDKALAKGVAGAEALKKKPDPGRQENLVYDLVHDDAGNADLGDFQMVFITLIAVITYLIQVFQSLRALDLSATVTLPDAGGTLLAAFGLGQGAYLFKKAASGSNPDPNPAGPAPGGGGGAGVGGAAPSAAAGGAASAGAPPRTRIGVEA